VIRRIHAALAITVVLALSGCVNDVYDVPVPGQVVSKDNSYRVTADFADALNVVPRTSVMVDDVPVGQVESVERVGWHARVALRVSKDIKLPDNARAQIRQTSLLGEKFIELTDPAATDPEAAAAQGQLGDGDVIPLDRTGLNPEVEDVLGALSVVLTGGGVGQLQTITQELNHLMSGRTGELKSLLGRLNTFVGTLDTQKGDIIGAMESINGLSSTLVGEKEVITNALDSVGPAVDVLRDQHKELVAMLTELDKLGDVGTRVITKTKDDLVAELKHLEPVLRELANTGDALIPGTIAAANYPFATEAGDAIHGDYANVIFSFQLNLRPVSEGGLLPTNLNDLENLCKGTPLAPICAPGGDAIDQLCGLLGTLPLCRQDTDLVQSILEQVPAPAGAPAASGAGDKNSASTQAAPPLPTDWFSDLFGGIFK